MINSAIAAKVAEQPLIFILNGPNLNMLGKREPAIYGAGTLADLETTCVQTAQAAGLRIDFRQSNHEGALVDWIQEAREQAAAMIINAGALTHTSVAVHDALRLLDIPVIEVHLSNIYRREAFRHHSYISAVARAVLCGFGAQGYELAIAGIARMLAQPEQTDG
ncbi:MAG: type II 3-dehydroquinate dehydratase [Alphaproteobacteria bacterium]